MMKISELLIATRNAGKVREIEQLLGGLPLRLRGLADFAEVTEVDETGTTFAENAVLKARAYASQTRLWTLADDSGLEVDALGGRPGVFSARYAGPAATYEERMRRLLEELDAARDPLRRARFVCVIAVAPPSADAARTFEGTCEGRIARAPRGSGGFGYDPLFVPDGYAQTFGELAPEVKQNISHRARALAGACAYLREMARSSA